MTKICKCGTQNDDNSTFCRNCGSKLSQIHSTTSDSGILIGNNKILLVVIVVLLMVIGIAGTLAYVNMTDDKHDRSNSNSGVSVDTGQCSSVSDSPSTYTKSWHKVDSFSGRENYQFTFSNPNGNRVKVVVSAMPLKNYGNNAMRTLITNGTHRVGTLILDWDSSSAVAVKTDSVESSLSGTFEVDIATYELEYWNLEIYEYY